MNSVQPNDSERAERLPSLAALQSLHKNLLQARRQDGDSDALWERIADLIRRGQLTGALLDVEDERNTAQAILDYWSAILFKADYTAPDATLAEFDPDLAPEIPDDACPYIGLDPFQEKNRDIFFGRERLVASLLEHLEGERLLVVVGPSGCGKSSIVLAGLLPALKNGALPGSADWHYATRMVPGSNPLANLVRVMGAMQADEISDPVAWAREQETALRQNPYHLAKLANSLSSTPIVGVVDQFEEVFTLCGDDGTRHAFLDNLINLVRAPEVAHRVILTMRTDFEPFVVRYPEFQALFERAIVRVTPLTAAELREAIEKPAQKVGLKFEGDLVDQLLHDVLGEPAALPLLQFTLLKLWDHRERNRITRQSYERLGGGRLALARSANEFFDQLIPEDQTAAKRIFMQLVRPGEGLEFTSNRVRLRTLYQTGEARDRVERVVDKLIEARLVRVTEGDVAADAQIEVAHEALVRNWPRLVGWLEDERHTLRQRQAVADAAERWQASGRDAGALYTTDTILAEALRVVAASGRPLNDQEAAFVEASKRAQEEVRQAKELARQQELEQATKLAEAERQRADEQTKAAGRLRRLTMGLILLALTAMTAATLAFFSAQTAGTARATAEAGATQVAANLKVAQDSLGAQVGLIGQVETAAAEKATLIAQIQTLAPTSTQTSAAAPTPLPTRTAQATLARLTPVGPTRRPIATPTRTPIRLITLTLSPPVMRPMDAAATATAMALAAQRSAVQATQTAIAGGATRIQTASSDLYVIVKWVPIVLRAEPGVSAPAIATVSPPNTLRVLDTSKNPWFLAESPTGEQGWLNGRLFVYGGNASLLPEDLRIRVITDRSDLPFVEGRIVSHDGVQKEYRPYVLPDEGSQEMNISVPIEWEVLVLLEDYGSRRFGSGKWYLVAFPDPGGRDVIYYGYLPVEVITER